METLQGRLHTLYRVETDSIQCLSRFHAIESKRFQVLYRQCRSAIETSQRRLHTLHKVSATFYTESIKVLYRPVLTLSDIIQAGKKHYGNVTRTSAHYFQNLHILYTQSIRATILCIRFQNLYIHYRNAMKTLQGRLHTL